MKFKSVHEVIQKQQILNFEKFFSSSLAEGLIQMIIMKTLLKAVHTSRLARPAGNPGQILTMLTCLSSMNQLLRTVARYSLRVLAKDKGMSQGSKK